MLNDVRVTIFDAKFGSVLDRDVSNRTTAVTYENAPDGCRGATIGTDLLWEEVFRQGIYQGRNGVEISTGDDLLNQDFAGPRSDGTARLYVSSTAPYDINKTGCDGQIYLWDGTLLTMGIPVLGVGVEPGGQPYIEVGPPATWLGNPTAIPAYAASATIVGRRVYSGRIAARDRTNARDKKMVFSCVGMTSRLNERNITYTFNVYDIGASIYHCLQQITWGDLVIDSRNFPVVGQTYSGTGTNTSVLSAITGALAANSTGDVWLCRLGHDRAPRLLNLYRGASNTYTATSTFDQSTARLGATAVTSRDEDTSKMFNSVLVNGDTDQVTGQPYGAIAQDNLSITTYEQIDAPPVSNTSLKSNDACYALAKTLLNEQAIPVASNSCVIYARNDGPVGDLNSQTGLANGDRVYGIECVQIVGFEGNNTPILFGIPMSVVSSIPRASSGERMQTITFQAVEPDWNAEVRERVNGAKHQVTANTQTPASIGQYCVSAEAFPPPYAGLSFAPPLFLAQFALGTQVVPVGNNGPISVVGGSTNYAWINPDNTWTVKQDPSPVPGAILYGFFSADLTHIVGFFARAPVGTFKIGVGNINFGNHPKPVASGSSLSTGYTDNSVHAQVNASVTLTNATADPTITGLAFYYALHGSTDPNKYKPVGETQLLQSGGAAQTAQLGFELGAGQNIDVYCGYVGIGSADYGPLSQIGSPAQITNGFIPASLVVTNAYLGAGDVTAPNVTSPLYLFVDSANGISSSVTLWFTITNQLTNGSLSRIAIYRRKTGSGALFDKVFDVPAIGLPHPSASQAYIVTANDLTNGVAYDWGVAFEDNQGGEAPPVPTNGIETRFADPAHGLIEQTPAIQVNIATALNVRSFGAKGDGKYTPYGHMLLGSTSLTLILESPFVSSDVGKTIMVGGAAAGGSDLYTTITAFINSTTVTLALAASTQVSNTGTFWGGTDDTAAIQSAINAAIDTASNVYIPAGTYLISSSLNYSPKLRRLFGDGPYKTNLIVTSPSINADIISFYDTNYFTLEGIYFRGPGINAGAGGVRFDLNIFGSQEGLIVKNVVVEGTGGNGVHMNAPILSTLENVKCYATAGFGFWAYNGTSTSFSKCYALTGVVDGFHLQSMTYCTMDSCAAEYAGSAYNLYNSNNITLNGCGGEQQMNRSVGYPGHAYVIDHCQSIVMNSCYSREVPAGVARHFIARGGSSNVHVNQMRVVQVATTDFDAEIAPGCSNIVFSSPSFTVWRLLNFGTSCGVLDGFGNDSVGNTPFGHGSMSPGTQQAISVSTGGILSTTYDIVSWAAGSGAATLASRNIAIPAGGTWISITTTFIGERNLSALVSFNAPGGYSGSAGWNPSDASINAAGDTSLPYTIVSILYGLPGGQTITVTATTTATSHTGTQTYGSGNMVTQLIRYA